MAEGKGRVCVTGGTGFLGSWIIKRLLEDGYSVNTTIRSDPARKRDISFLTNLPGASEKLQVFNADLSDPESFGPAVEGCVGIFHTASPIDFALNEPEEVVTKRTVDGALGILKACVNSKTVKRVVYTSSGSAVSFSGAEGDVLDESNWSNVDLLRSVKPFGWSYGVSKTLAEKAVLEFGEQNGIDVVTLIPTFVVGRWVCPKLPDSVEKALVLVLGKKDQINVNPYHMVHMDDVARAHIFLLEHANAKGRYNCSSFTVSIEEMSELLSAKYPEFQIPTVDELKEIKGVKLPHLISNKLVDAGFEFKYSIEDMFDDAIQCCKENGDKNPFSFSRLHMVHVDDVARAHIFLLEHPNPKGRYNCSPFIATTEEIAQLISSKYPEFQIPTLEELKKNEGPMKLPHLTSKKLMDAGFMFNHSLEEMFDDTIQYCKEKGYL